MLAQAESGNNLMVKGPPVPALGAEASRKARELSQLVVNCNEARTLAGKSPIFQYTDSSVAALCEMPWSIPRAKGQLGEFVDHLYFVLYEGAGWDELRFIGDELLSDEECGFIWDLKHLRNKWLRHDPNHGDSSSITKSKSLLKEALLHFGFDHIPTEAPEFRQLHSALLDGATGFLSRLLIKLHQ